MFLDSISVFHSQVWPLQLFSMPIIRGVAIILGLHETMIFNRFPTNKTLFCDLLKAAAENDTAINSALFLQPRVYDKVYFTMTEPELRLVARRRGDPELVEHFPSCDAALSVRARCIVLHVPAMALKLSQIPLRNDDPEGKVLFVIHLFACLFHELGHANHLARVHMETVAKIILGGVATTFDPVKSEGIAERQEETLMHRFGEVLKKSDLSWPLIADQLFEWTQLSPILKSACGAI